MLRPLLQLKSGSLQEDEQQALTFFCTTAFANIDRRHYTFHLQSSSASARGARGT